MKFQFLLSDVRLADKKIPFAYIAWFSVALIAVLAELFHHSFNNYLIFKNVFWHVIHQKNLYLEYPQEYFDHNYYGPVFSFVIAPLAVLPDWLGVILWVLYNATILFVAIKQLPFNEKATKTIFLISAIEFMTSVHNVQFNPMVAGWIILAYAFIRKEKDFWGTFFIALGAFTKIYGIVAILFFVFSKHKLKFIAFFLLWSLVLFCLPMLISSPAYIIQTYHDWYNSLIIKNQSNVSISFINMQDLTVMGMIRRIFQYAALPTLSVIGPAVILMGLPLLRFKLYQNTVFQLGYLAIALITVVIYSSSAESSTFVIAMAGVAIWYVINMHRNNTWIIAVLISALFITSLGSTDLVPQIIKRDVIRKFALKALPCFIVWLTLIYHVAFKDEADLQSPNLQLQ